jgi:hypothetical protein
MEPASAGFMGRHIIAECARINFKNHLRIRKGGPKMAEFLLCNRPCSLDSLEGSWGIDPGRITDVGGFAPSMLIPHRPYLLSAHPSGTDRSLQFTLNNMHMPQDITDMALAFGADTVVAISEIAAGLRQYGVGAAGASAGLYAQRMEVFTGAVKQYQDALLKYRDTAKSGPAARRAAEQRVVAAFKNMQKPFQNEILTVTSRVNSRKGTVLTNPSRGLNIARSSRNVAKLNVLNKVQANNLVNFGKYARFFGQGLVVIDFGSRVGHVHNSYQTGDNWEREMFIESTSFAASAGVGYVAGLAGAFLIGLTPVGWVGLIVGGVIVTAAAATVTINTNQVVRQESGAWYDTIMRWLGTP